MLRFVLCRRGLNTYSLTMGVGAVPEILNVVSAVEGSGCLLGNTTVQALYWYNWGVTIK